MKIGTFQTRPIQIKAISAKSPPYTVSEENTIQSEQIHFSGGVQTKNQKEGFWSKVLNFLLTPFRWLASIFGFGGSKANKDGGKPTRAVTPESKNQKAKKPLGTHKDEMLSEKPKDSSQSEEPQQRPNQFTPSLSSIAESSQRSSDHTGKKSAIKPLLKEESTHDTSLPSSRASTGSHHVKGANGQRRTPPPSVDELRVAIIRREPGRVKWLIEQGVDVNAPTNEHGATPLHHAVFSLIHRSGQERTEAIEVFNALLESGELNVNARDSSGKTPLHDAVEKLLYRRYNTFPEKAILALITRGADINAQDENRNTPLHLAAANNNISANVFRAMLKSPKGVNVNLRNKDRDTALHLAVENGESSKVELLRAIPGVDLNTPNKEGRKPLERWIKILR